MNTFHYFLFHTLFLFNALALAKQAKLESERYGTTIAHICLLSHSSSILAATAFLLGIPFLPALIHITSGVATLYVLIRCWRASQQ